MTRFKDNRGFTLLELLAAVALLVILGALMFQIFGQASAVMGIGNGRQEVFEYARILFEILQSDVDGLIGVRESGPDETGAPLRIGTSPAAVARFNADYGTQVREGADVLSFTSALVGRDTQEASPTRGEVANVAHVEYWVTPGNCVLNRHESYNSEKPGDGRGWEFALNVLEFKVEVLDQWGGGVVFERKDWDSGATVSTGIVFGAPKAMRVTVKMTDAHHLDLYEFDSTSKSMAPKPGVRSSDDPVAQEFVHVFSFPENQ